MYILYIYISVSGSPDINPGSIKYIIVFLYFPKYTIDNSVLPFLFSIYIYCIFN